MRHLFNANRVFFVFCLLRDSRDFKTFDDKLVKGDDMFGLLGFIKTWDLLLLMLFVGYEVF